ncbi:MAG: aminotransferase class I/II-fold pyridoxal phosphate-dependent enzyme [Acidobacteria bacterium]|nr:aminotransferase class I/II-fold pyridoxal phosphate-dependent enzyme [Acidobacteriota bacterium]
MTMSTPTHRPDTRVIHEAEGHPSFAHPLTTPIYETTTFLFPDAASLADFQQAKNDLLIYSRYGNPTVMSAEAKLAVLENAEAALVFGSGMAAVSTTVMALVSAGDELLCSGAIYGNTMAFFKHLERFGVTVRFLTLDETRDPSPVITPKAKLLWFESPINPTLRCIDIRQVADVCRARGVTTVIDSTFASPVNQQPLSLGVDVVMHSATKYLNGHSDVTAGAVAGAQAVIDRIRPMRRLLGTIIDPQPAFLLARSMKTVDVRVAKHNATAMAVAEWLSRDGRVSEVLYPGLPSHPDHAIAAAQMRGFGGMVTFDLGGSYERAARLFDRLSVVKRAASLGGVESLCSLPVLTSQYGWSDADLVRAGVTRGMVRLSIGLEDPQDLIADLDQALS